MSPWRWKGNTVPTQMPPWWLTVAVATLYRVDRLRLSPLVADVRRQRNCVRLGGHYWRSKLTHDGSAVRAVAVCRVCDAAMR